MNSLQEFESKYPKEEYSKTIYNFSQPEMRKLQGMDTIVQMGNIASSMMSQIINTDCLKRVAVKNSPDTGVLYDILTGTFTVFNPRVWCSICNNKKGTQELLGKFYCDEHFNLVKQAAPLSAEKSPKKANKQ